MSNVLNKIKTNNFIKDVSITTFGQLIVMILTFLLNKVISIKLGPENYMEYSLINKSASVITYFMILSLGIAIPRYISIYRMKKDTESEKNCFTASLLIVLIATIITFTIFYLLKYELAIFIFGKNVKYIGYILPTLFFALQIGLSTLLYSYYRGIDDFFRYNITQCIYSVMMIVICILFDNLLRMINIMSFLGILYSLVHFVIIKKSYKSNKFIDSNEEKSIGNEMKKLCKYSIPRVPGEFILFSFVTIPLIIINKRIGLQESVAYSISIGIISSLSPFFRYIGMVLLPYTSKKAASNDLGSIKGKIKKLSIIYLIFSIISVIFVLIFTKFVIIVLYSREYLTYINIVRIMIFAIIPNSLYLLYRNPIDAVSKYPHNTINLLISFIIMIAMIYFSNNTYMYGVSFVLGYLILGILSFITWKNICKKKKNTIE